MPYARRVQRVGSGTLTVSLPRRWVEKIGLKPGDIVSIVELSDTALKIETKTQGSPQHAVFTLDASKVKDKQLAARLVIGAYLQGFEEINIVGSEGIPEEVQEAVIAATDLLPGVEVVEHSSRKIVIQSFLDPNRFPVSGIIKRIQVMLTNGLNNLSEALKEGRKEPLSEISKMENKVDELYFLCIRQIFVSVRREVWGEEAADSYLGAIGDRLVVRSLEEVADSIKLAAEEATKLIEKGVPKTVINKLLKHLDSIQVLFNKTMKSFLSLDINIANEIIETTTTNYGEEMTFNDVFHHSINDLQVTISLRNFVYNIINIARSCKTIAEVTINRFVRTPSKLITVEMV